MRRSWRYLFQERALGSGSGLFSGAVGRGGRVVMLGVVVAGEEAEVDADRTRKCWIFAGGNLARAER